MTNNFKSYLDGKKQGIQQSADAINTIMQANTDKLSNGVLLSVLTLLQTQLNDLRRLENE